MGLSRFLSRRRRELEKAVLAVRSVCAGFEQRRIAAGLRLEDADELIVFFVPTVYECNGGVMSIASLAATTRKLKPSAMVVTATMPGDPTLAKNSMFPNDEAVLTLGQICRHARPAKAILHLPEMSAGDFVPELSPREREWLKSIPDLHINILDQNIDLMHPRADWVSLFSLTSNVTQTTAHESCATQEICNRYGIPLHHFSVNIDHSWWPRRPFEEKEKLIVFSPDPNEWEPKVREAIRRGLPEYRIEVVNNMTFVQYLDLVSRAMFVMSFGEGFDGYFIQPFQTGTVGVAAYLPRFFPSEDWLRLDNVYSSYEEMANKFPGDVRRWESDKAAYDGLISRFREMDAKLYFDEALEDNMARFYRGEYDFYPE